MPTPRPTPGLALALLAGTLLTPALNARQIIPRPPALPATPPACERSPLPLRNARRGNSPGRAILAPSRRHASSTLASTSGFP